MERQVRLAARALVLLGLLLALLVHPAFQLLSAAVGAGLAFSTLTDTCGMALVLGRLPFNRRRQPLSRPHSGTVPSSIRTRLVLARPSPTGCGHGPPSRLASSRGSAACLDHALSGRLPPYARLLIP
ncbi:YgaP-like transmembrane domain [Streptomyces subrutilus]|uniref:YgaP-like transmembrane domain n=1 Tax=Streptomyces subrutilus TaxID=36818 RepID=UPI0033DCD44E